MLNEPTALGHPQTAGPEQDLGGGTSQRNKLAHGHSPAGGRQGWASPWRGRGVTAAEVLAEEGDSGLGFYPDDPEMTRRGMPPK